MSDIQTAVVSSPDQDAISRLVALSDEISALDGVRVAETIGTLRTWPEAFAITAGINGELVGFASGSPGNLPEVGLAVHPSVRRQGIGRLLLSRVRDELVSRGHSEALLVSEGRSTSGTQFLDAAGAEYSFSEFRLERSGGERPRVETPGFATRAAGQADRDVLVDLLARSFGDEPEQAAQVIDAGLRETERHFAIAALDGVPIGCVRLGAWEGIGDITALGVVPEYRGRGLGRALLLSAVAELTEQGLDPIALEVETDNLNALGLYQACGFTVTNEFRYYTFPLGA